MIIIVGGIKGGSGKTTIATNLTVMRSRSYRRVLLVDADEQRSASDWAEQRASMGFLSSWTTIQLSGSSLNSQVIKLSASFDDIIIDAGGRDTTSQRSALSIADKFLIPFQPRGYDIWTMGKVRSLIYETIAINPSLRCYAFLNQADPSGKDNEEALAILKEDPAFGCLDTYITNRKVYSNTATKGLGVVEARPINKLAITEMTYLYLKIYDNDMTTYMTMI